jgi:DNA-binding NtrC family response regulator
VKQKAKGRRRSVARRATGDLKPASAKTVLSFGYAKVHLMQRHRLLAKHGYDVVSVSDLRLAMSLAEEEATRFSVLVIGHAVPKEERLRLTSSYQTRNPAGKVIFLYRHSIDNAACAAALLSVDGSTDNLIVAIRLLA